MVYNMLQIFIRINLKYITIYKSAFTTTFFVFPEKKKEKYDYSITVLKYCL